MTYDFDTITGWHDVEGTLRAGLMGVESEDGKVRDWVWTDSVVDMEVDLYGKVLAIATITGDVYRRRS